MTQRMEIGVCREQSAPPTVWHLLFLLSGVYSILLLLPSVSGLVFSAGWIYLCAGVICVILWAARRVGWQWAMLTALVFTLVWLADCLLLWDTLCTQLRQLTRYFNGLVHTVRFTETAFLLSALIALLFFTLEFFLESHMFPYILTSVLMLIGPVMGVRPSVEAVVLGVIFQMSFWTVHETGIHQTRSDFALPNRSRLTSLTAAFMAGILLITMLAAVPFSMRRADDVYAPIYQAEGVVRRTLNHLTGMDAQPVTGGTISRGNRYDTGTSHLLLTADRRPSQTVYLRGFSGGEYLGGEWSRANDADIFKRMAERLRYSSPGVRVPTTSEKLDDITSLVSRTYYAMYYALNQQIRRENPPEPLHLQVQHVSGEYRTSYTPYYSYRTDYDADAQSYAFSFYEQEDMNIQWDSLPPALNTGWYYWVQSAYAQESRRVYTQVPRKILPRLTQLYQDNPKEDLDEITAFILHTLHSYASYSLTPGWTPFNEEIVEYFLFDNGLGYCQHFAAAATLLYRLYGIPARYATGYVVHPDDFSYPAVFSSRSDASTSYVSPYSGEEIPFPGTDERFLWRAELTDMSAHAWVEIWLDDYGWTPVEVTPASDEPVSMAYPGLESETLSGMLADLQRSLPTLPRRSGNVLIPRTPESLLAAGAAQSGITFHEHAARFIRILALSALWAFPAGLYLYRRRRLLKWANAPCRVTFGKMLSMLHFAGLLRGYDGSEPDFVRKLSECLPELPGENVDRLYREVQSAAYGYQSPPPETDVFVRDVCAQTAQILFSRLLWWKKPLFRYAYGSS